VWRDATPRSVLVQILFLGIVGLVIYEAAATGVANMRAHHIPADFAFWNEPAGFDIDQRLIAYSAASTYGRAFLVGLLNTLIVAAIGIVLASLLGFALGAARLSANFVVARLAAIYVEVARNVPLLLQLLFWYNAVLKALPGPRQSLALPGRVYLNDRGLFVPEIVFVPAAIWVLLALVLGTIVGIACWTWARRRWSRGVLRSLLIAALPVVAFPVVAYFVVGQPIGFNAPVFKGFNFNGGEKLLPEFVALVLGLVLYTAAFIAEIVRAGIEGVPKGQSEAAAALGLRAAQARKYVIVPEAMRLIVPPLTNQYLNLLKNSSLAVFIGYPDLVQVFAGTVLNQTGAAVPVIATTMAVYLAISLLASLGMNLFNHYVVMGQR